MSPFKIYTGLAIHYITNYPNCQNPVSVKGRCFRLSAEVECIFSNVCVYRKRHIPSQVKPVVIGRLRADLPVNGCLHSSTHNDNHYNLHIVPFRNGSYEHYHLQALDWKRACVFCEVVLKRFHCIMVRFLHNKTYRLRRGFQAGRNKRWWKGLQGDGRV